MARNFYFGRYVTIAAGSANFASLISTGFASYGITSAQSASFATLNTALQVAQEAAAEPTTKTKVTVLNRKHAVAAMRENAKLLARIIYATSTVTDGQLAGLGLLPRSTPSPRPIPTTAPVVEVISVSGRIVKFRVHSATSESRGKPAGAIGANIYSYVGPAFPSDPSAFDFQGMTTRAITEVQFPNTLAGGTNVWVSACWVTARGQTSIASTPIAVTIQGGSVLPLAA